MTIRVLLPRDLAGMKSHLIVAHGVWAGDVKTVAEARLAHRADHDQPYGQGRIPHVHEEKL